MRPFRRSHEHRGPRRRTRQKLYEQWTGCPGRCECGRVCGWRPGAPSVEDPEMVRFGKSTGMGNRLSGYQREAEYFDQVGVIGMRHLPPGTSDRKTLDVEAGFIDFHRPPFNIQHNPDHDTDEQERDRHRIMRQPVPWQTTTGWMIERAGATATRFALWVVSSAVGAVVLTVAIAAL